METFHSSSLPLRTRASAWNALYSARIAPADLTTDGDDFEAELRVGAMGPIGVVRMTCGRSCIDRTPRHIVHTPDRTFTFILQARGSGVFAHYGHESTLEPGDFVLCDSAAPHSYRVDRSAEVLMLRVSATVLKEHLPSPECFCGRRLDAAQGLTSTMAALTLSVCEQFEAGLSLDFHARVARHLLELIATSYAMAFEALISRSSIIGGRHANVKLYIEQHLRDPELSPSAIAGRLKLSSRYLRMIFAAGNETVSAYILRRRLEECARQMVDACWRGHSISEIAFAWGFNSAPHFTRSFRERFKVSPRDYRRQLGREPAASSARPSRTNPHRLHVDQLANAGGTELASVAR